MDRYASIDQGMTEDDSQNELYGRLPMTAITSPCPAISSMINTDCHTEDTFSRIYIQYLKSYHELLQRDLQVMVQYFYDQRRYYNASFKSFISLQKTKFQASIENIISIQSKLLDLYRQRQWQYERLLSYELNASTAPISNQLNALKHRNDSVKLDDLEDIHSKTPEITRKTVQNQIIRPEHFPRTSKYPLHIKASNPSIQPFKSSFRMKEIVPYHDKNTYIDYPRISPWEGSQYKISLIESLISKFQKKLIFSILIHNRHINQSRSHGVKLLILNKSKRLLRLCFISICLEVLSSKRLTAQTMWKASQYYNQRHCARSLRMFYSITQYRIGMKRYIYKKASNCYARYRLRRYFDRLRAFYAYRARIGRLADWAEYRDSQVCGHKALLGWMIEFIKSTAMKVSLYQRLTGSTSTSFDEALITGKSTSLVMDMMNESKQMLRQHLINTFERVIVHQTRRKGRFVLLDLSRTQTEGFRPYRPYILRDMFRQSVQARSILRNTNRLPSNQWNPSFHGSGPSDSSDSSHSQSHGFSSSHGSSGLSFSSDSSRLGRAISDPSNQRNRSFIDRKSNGCEEGTNNPVLIHQNGIGMSIRSDGKRSGNHSKSLLSSSSSGSMDTVRTSDGISNQDNKRYGDNDRSLYASDRGTRNNLSISYNNRVSSQYMTNASQTSARGYDGKRRGSNREPDPIRPLDGSETRSRLATASNHQRNLSQSTSTSKVSISERIKDDPCPDVPYDKGISSDDLCLIESDDIDCSDSSSDIRCDPSRQSTRLYTSSGNISRSKASQRVKSNLNTSIQSNRRSQSHYSTLIDRAVDIVMNMTTTSSQSSISVTLNQTSEMSRISSNQSISADQSHPHYARRSNANSLTIQEQVRRMIL